MGEDSSRLDGNPVQQLHKAASMERLTSPSKGGFAGRKAISNWVLRINDDSNLLVIDQSLGCHEHEARSSQRMGRKLSGWRAGLTISSGCTGAVFTLNLVLTFWAIRKFGIWNSRDGILVQGECSQTRTASTWIHLAINILSTLLLSASNYCMQILTAPTRREIDRSHAIRNLRWISRERVCIWILLALTSLPLHLVYNSAVYDTLTANEYDLYIASDSLLTNTSLAHTASSPLYSAGDAAHFLGMARERQLERLDPVACVQAYGKSLVSERKDVALICSEWHHGWYWSSARLPVRPLGEKSSTFPYDWICSYPNITGSTASPNSIVDQPCFPNAVIGGIERDDKWNYPLSFSNTDNNTIEYCLSQKTQEQCQLQFNVEIMGVVIIANLLKLLCMLYTIWRVKSPTLVTIGDTISSFLQNPDHATAGRCTLSKLDVEEDEKWFSRSKRVPGSWRRIYRPVPAQPQAWMSKRLSWSDSVSKTRRNFSYFCCFTTLVVVGLFLGLGKSALKSNKSSSDIKSLWNMGFGAVSPVSLVEFGGRPNSNLGLVGIVLLVNAPQVILSFLYLTYNNIFTCQLLSREWTSYALKRKALRVTTPNGIQRSTYFLQLPYTYSLPLMACSGIMHWLVSQSIFLARVNVYDRKGDGDIDPEQSISTIGYSCIALISVSILGFLLLIVGAANGWRKYPSGVPLAATCSAAISAACHPPLEDVDAAFEKVQYGDVGTKDGVRHCTFTSLPVMAPVARDMYA